MKTTPTESQCERVMEILSAQMQRLLAHNPNDADDFQVAYSAALAIIRGLDEGGIIGDDTLLMLVREATETRGKSKAAALALLSHEFDHPSVPPWERNAKLQQTCEETIVWKCHRKIRTPSCR